MFVKTVACIRCGATGDVESVTPEDPTGAICPNCCDELGDAGVVALQLADATRHGADIVVIERAPER